MKAKKNVSVKRVKVVKPASAKSATAKIRNLREALDVIQEMLMEKPYSRDLWNVLTALRGPDTLNTLWDDPPHIKLATTSVIRDAAFPKRPTDSLALYAKDSRASLDRRLPTVVRGTDMPSHFISHVQVAFESLGLNWRAVNA